MPQARPICHLRSARGVCTFRGVNVPRKGSLEGAPATAQPRPPRRALLAVRGALAASALGVSSVAGAIGAFLALLPAALRPIPRGRLDTALPPAPTEASREPLAG
jgi:hypothetical protein